MPKISKAIGPTNAGEEPESEVVPILPEETIFEDDDEQPVVETSERIEEEEEEEEEPEVVENTPSTGW